jgi:hypothetical protein
MRKIKKLSPNIIKKIIEEEKRNIQATINKNKELEKRKLLESLRLLKKVVEKEKKLNESNKSLKTMKRKIIKRLKK